MTASKMLPTSITDAAVTVRIRLERGEMGIGAFRAELGRKIALSTIASGGSGKQPADCIFLIT